MVSSCARPCAGPSLKFYCDSVVALAGAEFKADWTESRCPSGRPSMSRQGQCSLSARWACPSSTANRAVFESCLLLMPMGSTGMWSGCRACKQECMHSPISLLCTRGEAAHLGRHAEADVEGHFVVAQITSKRGARCYIAVAGGINTPAYLGSRSTFPGGKLGGVQACRSLPATYGHVWTTAVLYQPGVMQRTRMLDGAYCTVQWSIFG